MYYPGKICIGVLFLTFIMTYSCSEQQKVDVDADKAAIQKIIDDHMDAADSLDVDRILADMTDDILVMPPNVSFVSGKDAYKEYFASWIPFLESLKDKKMTFNVTDFVITGNWAFQIGTYNIEFILQDNSTIVDEGNYIWMFRKETDGTWKWAREISNSSLPIETSH